MIPAGPVVWKIRGSGPLFDVSVCRVVACPVCSASGVSPDKPHPGSVGWHDETSQSLLHEGEETGALLWGQGGQAQVGPSRSWVTSSPGPPARSLLQCTRAEPIFSIRTSLKKSYEFINDTFILFFPLS